MSCCQSILKALLGHYAVADTAYNDPEILQHKSTFDSLNLSSRNVSALLEVFRQIDKDRSGEISCREMLDHLKLDKTKFTTRIFSIMDEDGSGEIDFREFCIALWNYCTLGKAALILFAFDLYDNDSSGEIDVHEIELMLKEVYGRAAKHSTQAQSVMAQITSLNRSNYDGEAQVNKEEFSAFVRRNPGLLYPAFQLQQKLQQSILGVGFWEDLAQTRIKLCEGAYVSVSAMLAVQVNKEALDALVKHNPRDSGKDDTYRTARPRLGQGELREVLEDTNASQLAGSVAERRLKGEGFRSEANVVRAAHKWKSMRGRGGRGRHRGQMAGRPSGASASAPPAHSASGRSVILVKPSTNRG